MKRLFLSAIFALVAFASSAQLITINLSTTKTYFKTGTTSYLTTITSGSESNTKKLIDTNLIVINVKENTATLKGSGVYYEETVEISSLNENYGKITFNDEINNFNYVIDLNRNTVFRVLITDTNTSVVEYQISKIIEQ